MIPQELRVKIIDTIFSHIDFYGNDILFFIDKIWPLRSMPSEDPRFKDAYGDFRQHLFNNHDWDVRYAFYDRLQLHTGDIKYFIGFLETLVHPQIRKDVNEIQQYVKIINALLYDTQYILSIETYFDRLPVFKILDKTAIPIESKSNELIVGIIAYYKNQADRNSYPCFSLQPTENEDYGYKTEVGLFYHLGPAEVFWVGKLKILHETRINTWESLPDTFIALPDLFCSMGSDIEYYTNIKYHFPKNYHERFLALRDVALFPDISATFEQKDGFRKSLIGNNVQEKIWRTLKFKIDDENVQLDNDERIRYDFIFQVRPPYAEEPITLDFNFNSNSDIKHRIYGLIGKNGTGKTYILSQLANDLSERNAQSMVSRKPLFSKVITISYSYFDQFKIPISNVNYTYAYCGLKNKEGGILSQEDLLMRFLTTADVIRAREMTIDWYNLLSHFIRPDVLEIIFAPQHQYKDFETGWTFNPARFNEAKARLSSGQHILIYILTELLAEIRENTLILFDEPETHLHPNAITELMNSILDLVERFDSYCIIGTHSPIVIQCIQSRDVIVLDREENLIRTKELDIESFGQNLTVITEDIFGTREVQKHYLDSLKALVQKGKTMEDIVGLLQHENGLSMNLNMRLYLKSLFEQQ